jgi:nucleoside-diphosphate-sugar epimerase
VRIAILGGTRFIGRAIVEELHGHGHTLLLLHRGEHVPEGLAPEIERRLCDRADVAAVAGALSAFGAEALIDTRAMARADAEAALAAAGRGLRLLVLSSMDVYRAYGSLLGGRITDAVPIDESGPVRVERFPYRDKAADRYDYEKLDVEALYLARGATVCRLPAVYGERDYQRREEFVLRRVRAGRPRIPIGAGTWVWTRGYVADMARGVRLALESERAQGEVFNLGERRTLPVRLWMERILEAAGAAPELVRVPDEALPEDLEITGAVGQPLLFDSSKARDWLGFCDSDPAEAIARSVRWHLAHPPEDASDDFSADDRALASAR